MTHDTGVNARTEQRVSISISNHRIRVVHLIIHQRAEVQDSTLHLREKRMVCRTTVEAKAFTAKLSEMPVNSNKKNGQKFQIRCRVWMRGEVTDDTISAAMRRIGRHSHRSTVLPPRLKLWYSTTMRAKYLDVTIG